MFSQSMDIKMSQLVDDSKGGRISQRGSEGSENNNIYLEVEFVLPVLKLH